MAHQLDARLVLSSAGEGAGVSAERRRRGDIESSANEIGLGILFANNRVDDTQ